MVVLFIRILVFGIVCLTALYSITSDNFSKTLPSITSTSLLVITPKISGQQGEFAAILTGLPKVFEFFSLDLLRPGYMPVNLTCIY